MSVTMLPSGGAVTGFNPNSGSNSFVDEVVGTVSNPPTNGNFELDPGKDALSQLFDLSKTNPEYMETYLQLLAERENTTAAQAWYEKMSGSQYQRAAKDLQAAGLNPYLALQSLGGAGSGSVSPAGSWSTSPYSNKMARSQAESQSLNARANAIKAGLAGLTAIVALAALML